MINRRAELMVDEIDGVDRVRELLLAAAVHFDVGASEAPLLCCFDGGVLIQAGEFPESGDRLNERVPVADQVVKKPLRRRLFADYRQSPHGLIRVPVSVEPLQATLDWVTRFDMASADDATVEGVGEHV